MTANENRIKELETELERLKRENELTKRLEQIEKKFEERERKTDDELENLKLKYSELLCGISSMENDIYNIIVIANKMYEKRFSPMTIWHGKTNHCGFSNDTIELKNKPFNVISSCNSDYIHVDCKLNDNDEIEIHDYYGDTTGTYSTKSGEISSLKLAISGMEYFIKYFPEFRDKFYEKIDNL